jgi:hypothetical protein
VSPSEDRSRPLAEYTRRAAGHQAQADRLAARYLHFFRSRTAAIVLIVAVAWLLEKERLVLLYLGMAGVIFVISVVVKNRAWRGWQQALRGVRFYQRRLVNLGDDWPGTGDTGDRFLDDDHPCARDLDLFGPGSLFERLHLPGTPLGADTLAAWLLAPAGAEMVRARQAAVAELRDRLDLREDLALLGETVPDRSAVDSLTAWAAASSGASIGLTRAVAAVLTGLVVLALLGWFLGLGVVPLLAALALNCVVALGLRHRFERNLPTAAGAAHLAPVLLILARLQRERFDSPLLRAIQDTLGSARPLAHLARLLKAMPFAPLAYPLLGTTHLALALETWRRQHGTVLSRWLATLGGLEALNALAAYAYENPADPFPEVMAEGPCFDAEGLGHPLLSAARCVRNDLRLDARHSLLIVSGSNMSGKSTLLRAVGVNAVLALAGAPVRAARLRLARLTPGATLRLEDSLLQGRSRFYAEVLRIRQLLDLAQEQPPLLFLLDELFSGTNSEDRRQGAEAVVRLLLDRGAIGLLTTHDLALTHLADALAPRAANVHFADQVSDGALAFDYRMRPGVLRSGNGVALMRAVGIEV